MVWVVRIFSAFRWLLAAIGLMAIILVALLAVPVSRPPELPSIRTGAIAIDQSGLPSLSYFQARDGTSLAYRLYPAADGNTQRIAIVIHGSAGHSTGMNEIAKRLAADNFIAVAPDIRGHGGSGTRGDIGYLGQLDNDLQDLLGELRRQHHDAHFSLLEFSAGGGLRYGPRPASSPRTSTASSCCRPISGTTRLRRAARKARHNGRTPTFPASSHCWSCGASTFAAAKRCRLLLSR